MADPVAATEALFETWREQFERGAQAWARLLDRSPAAPPDPSAFWAPVVEQWVRAWARVFAQLPMTPDGLAEAKRLIDQSIEAWSKALGHLMGTEAFAQMLAKYLDQWLAAVGPMKKANEQVMEGALQAFGVASRAQLTAVAKQIVELEDRVERIEDGVREILRRLRERG
jgi:phosphoglycolate phosphatase-like HAD superfamily hydrolase